MSESVCPWYTMRKSLFQVLDDFPPMQRDPTGALRLPIMARYKDMGALFCLGKLESGTLYKDRKMLMMPNKVHKRMHKYTSSHIVASKFKEAAAAAQRISPNSYTQHAPSVGRLRYHETTHSTTLGSLLLTQLSPCAVLFVVRRWRCCARASQWTSRRWTWRGRVRMCW